MHTPAVLAATLLLSSASVLAHPGGHAYPDSGLLAKRAEKTARCANAVGAMKQKRHQMRKREQAAQELAKRGNVTTFAIHAEAPHYDFIKNDTCILYPETTQGPYWYPPSQLLTQDMAQDQAGVPFELDIGVIDMATCEPLENALISLWHCNATGSYSSYTGRDPNTPFLTLLEQLGITDPSNYTDFQFLATDTTTWLRGMWPTDASGATSFKTIVPGFYIDRSLHIHAQVHTNWSVTVNGTIDHSSVVETGQIFIDEPLSAQIMAMEPYASHTEIERLKNSGDGIYAQQAQSGAMPFVDTEPLDGVDYANGVLGYITLAIDTTTIKNGTSQPPNGFPINSTTAN
ncbi:hypothetical protein SMMN14_07729 [Sphaerulina musiva]